MNLRALHSGLIGVALAASYQAFALEVPTDRLIVRLEGGAPALQKSALEREAIAAHLTARSGEMMLPLRVMGDGAQVMQLFRRLSAAEVQGLSARVAGTPGVIEVLPDRIFFPALTPNDSLYAQQWYLTAASGINAPAAWDITTGSPNLIIGIVDTGKLPHDELAARWIGGYDFVSVPARQNDGTNPVTCTTNPSDPDCRDSDASDPGDWVTSAEAASGPLAGCPTTDSRWHGTLMAGVIAASANNGAGIAGLNWNSRLLPVRVVGKCGGYESDIADGMRWAVGIPVSGVPANPDTADLLNVSLAAPGPCSSALQSAVNEVIAAGAPIIVAAGNFSLAASGYSPGNCTGVIAVGAVDRNGGKASYTNFGPPIAFSAPGGKALQDFVVGDSPANQWVVTTSDSGVLDVASSTRQTAANDSIYAPVFGTSIAAAQVTGIASLMLSLNPTLAPQYVREILQNTARAFPTNTTVLGSQADCTAALCGGGIAEAAAATQAASQWGQAVSQVVGAQGYAHGLRSDGTVYGWGDGYLGRSTYETQRVPVVVDSLAGVVRLAAGVQARHTLALRADGTLWAWGDNSEGQLGDGSTTARSTPQRVAGLSGVTRAARSYSHSLALTSDGVWAWGGNNSGQLGGGGGQRLVPGVVQGIANVTEVAASHTGSFARKSDGSVWGWGEGQSTTPMAVAGFAQITAISAGYGHLLGLASDRTVWAWGENITGALGDGTVLNNYTAAQQVLGLTGVVEVAAGARFSLALKDDGTVWAWGTNENGQLGDGTLLQRLTPVQVLGLTGVRSIGAGLAAGYAIKPDGSLWAWGNANSGALGDNGTGIRTLPVQVLGVGGAGYLDLGVADPASFAPQTDVPLSSVRISNAIPVSGIASGAAVSVVGGEYSVGCTASFTAASGTISNGQTVCVRQTSASSCGTATTTTLTVAGFPVKTFTVTTGALFCDTTPDAFTFVPQAGVALGATVTSNAVTITGISFPAPIGVTGGAYSVGCTAMFTSAPGTISNGQTVCVRQSAAATHDTLTTATLTVGGVSAPFDAITVVGPSFSAVSQAVGAQGYAHGLRSDGTVYGWGDGYLGRSTYETQRVPVVVDSLAGVVRLAAGVQARHTLALRADGTLWAWGDNSEGQLGDGSTTARSTPQRVAGLSGVTRAARSYSHSLALTSDGVWAWGGNNSGQLGGGGGQRLVPGVVQGIANVTEVAASHTGSFARKSDGSVWGWGEGQSTTPMAVAGFAQITAISAGYGHLLGLASDRTVWAWGENITGALGDGTVLNNYTAAQQVLGLTGVVEVAAGARFSLALKDDGTVWAWGTNENGQLGDGTLLQRLTPVQVLGLTGVRSIGAGLAAGYAIKPDGSLWAWGNANSGALGDNGTGIRTLPVQVLGVGGAGYLDLGVADPASFAPQTDVPLSSVRISNAIPVSGIASGAAVSVVGGEYSVGCTASFTAASGTISNGQTVCVRQTSASSCGTATTTTLTVAGFPVKTFTVTTGALFCDTTPDAFTFVPQAGVALGATVTSNAVTITGISFPAPIGVTGGAYSVGCTAMFTSAPGTISNGQTVCVRQSAAATHDTLTTATLTVGGVSAPFDAITVVGPSFSAVSQAVGAQGYAHGLRSDGTVYGWGDGYLGRSTYETQRVPVVVDSLAGVVRLAAGVQARHTLALRADGTLWAWGDNSEGQLGDGSTTARSTPQRVAGLSGVTRAARSYSHSLALTSDGVWAWGGNNSGQLGGGGGQRLVPGVVQGIANVTEVAASHTGSFARKSDGSVWGWGEGQSTTPMAVAGFAQITAISAGYGHLLGLASDRTVWAWGENITGALGDGTVLNNYTAAQQVLGLTGVVEVAAGARFSLALKDDGTVWAWGTNENGQLGDGTLLQRLTPVQVLGLTGVRSIGAGLAAGYAIKPDGSLWAWGNANSGALGDNGTGIRTLPVQVQGPQGDGFLSLELFNTIPAPFAFTASVGVQPSILIDSNAITVSGLGAGVSSPVTVTGGEYSRNGGAFTSTAGTVANGDSIVVRVMSAAAFSTTTSATLMIGGVTGRSSTLYVRTRSDPGASRVVPQVAAGDSHTFLLASDGIVYAAGYNGNGQLGNGTTLGLSTLRPVAGLTSVVAIASGAFHGLALRNDGTVAAWGSNAAGQLGHDSTNAQELYPVNAMGLTTVEAVAAGRYHSVALGSGGTVWAWGLNAEGQVGDGSLVATRPAPVPVSGVSAAIAVAAGGRHTLALLAGGTVVAWGANEAGQLGDGSNTQRNAPVAVSGLSNVVAIAAGDAHSLALKGDGTVVAWGFNAFGQLGIGSTANSSVPVPVTGLGNNVGLIAAGANHSLAVKVGGGLYTWGNNANSQLGNGGNTNGLTPSLIALPSNVVAIAGGARHSAAIDTNRRLYLWGDNFFGQVGNRSGNYNPHSAALNVLRGDSVVSTGAGFGGGTVPPGNNSGSSVLEIDNQQTGFDFGSRSAAASILGRFKNQAALEDITAVSLAVTGTSFSLSSNTCPATLTPDQECTFSIDFNPAAATNFSGELVVNSSVVGSPERRAIFGSGIPPASAAISFAKAGLDFAPQLVGQTSMATFALNNSGNAPLTVTGITSSTTDFSATHTCTNVPGGAPCQLDVTFAPTAAGARTAILTVTSNASGSPHTVTVSGTGAPTTVVLDPLADPDGDGIPNGVEIAEGRNPNVKDNDIFAIARLFAMQQYRDFLGREGEAAGIDFFVDLLNTGAAVRGNVVESFFNSPEFQGSVAPIVRLYFATFLRIPDYGGLLFQTNAFRTGTPLEVIANNFTLSPEFQATYGSLTNSQYVVLLYQNILNRTPSQPEIDFHVARLTSGVTRGAVLVGFSESPEYQQASAIDVYVTMMYVGMLRRAPEQAGFDFWVDYMEAGNPGLALILGFLQAPEYRNRFLPP